MKFLFKIWWIVFKVQMAFVLFAVALGMVKGFNS